MRPETENEPVPAAFSGDFVLSVGSSEHVVDGTSCTLTLSGSFTAYVAARQLGYRSSAISVWVGSDDGEYVA